ncbi:MAG: sulfite exporter TauE/SafE family protein [Alicyclobacillaceae bacterium]|nr:sulfite exporter TauE/SafE family protein [Alicyclobacillaceae bacterium]
MDIGFAAVGFLAGGLGSLVGLGGGFIIVPFLTLAFLVPARFAAGTSTAVIAVNALASTIVYFRQRRIDLTSAAAFAAMAIPGSFLGARLSSLISSRAYDVSFGALMLAVSLFLVFRPREAKRARWRPTTTRRVVDAAGNTFEYAFNLPAGLGAAFGTGFLSSLFGIGGGTVLMPVMVLLLGFPAHIAVATSMFVVLISAVVGGISHALLGDVIWEYALFLAIGAWAGGQVGALVASRVPAQLLLRVLAVLMIATAIRLMAPAF